jgi:hypothetical protein
MKHDLKTYGILLGIFIISVGSGYFIPVDAVLKAVMAAPGVLAMLSALFQLIRDQAAFERAEEAQQKQFQFALGAPSHMANTAFDMHVDFCEKYMDEIHKTFHILFREGDTPKVLEKAGNFHQLRDDYAVWLTEQIDENLGNFEQALRNLGASAKFIKDTRGDSQYSSERTLHINGNFTLFDEILGFDSKKEINEEYAIKSVKKKLRLILGIEELTGLRTHVIKEASDVLAKSI